MKHLATTILLSLVGLFGCTHTGPFDPTLTNDGFRGITYTDEQGMIVGPIDPTDWQLNDNSTFYSFPDSSYCGNYGGLVPDCFGVRAAYPNPFSDSTTLELEIPRPTTWSLSIIDENHRILYSVSGYNEAGTIHLNWKPEDQRGHRLQSGIYRVIYRLCGLYGHGDLWFTNHIPSQLAKK